MIETIYAMAEIYGKWQEGRFSITLDEDGYEELLRDIRSHSSLSKGDFGPNRDEVTINTPYCSVIVRLRHTPNIGAYGCGCRGLSRSAATGSRCGKQGARSTKAWLALAFVRGAACARPAHQAPGGVQGMSNDGYMQCHKCGKPSKVIDHLATHLCYACWAAYQKETTQ